MAEDLGTLQYEMIVSDEKLKKSLDSITAQIKAKEVVWNEAFENVGAGGTFDTSKLVAANRTMSQSTDQIKSKISELRAELKKNILAYEEMDAATRKNGGASALTEIQKQKDLLNQLGQSYRQSTTDKRKAVADAVKSSKDEKDAIVSLESQRSKAFTKAFNESEKLQKQRERLLSTVRNSPKNSVERLQAYNGVLEFDKKNSTDAAQIDRLTKSINSNKAAIIQLNEENKKKLKLENEIISAQKAEIKLNERNLVSRNKLQSTVDNTPLNSIAKLDAERAVLNFDKKTSKGDAAEVDRLTQAINANKSARKDLIDILNKQKAAEKQAMQEGRLKLAIDSQQAGSIGKLRAENALYAYQITKLNPLIATEADEILRLNNSIGENNQQVRALQPTLNIWGRLISAIRTYATAYISVQAVMGLGKAVYNQTKELDQLAFGMKTVIKSSVELANTQKFLSEVAVNYGGDLLTLSERYIKFRAAAQQSNMSAAETQKIFDSMSKAAGTLGLKTDELSGVYLALEQMISKGKVTTEELRRQLGERLPGAFGIMANALGVTIPQLDKMLKKGEVLSKDALPKFADAIEKAYGIESLKKIDTLAAAQGRMSTEFTGLIQAMDKSDFFKGVLNGIASFIGFIKDNMGAIGMFARGMLAIGVAQTAYKLSAVASLPIQRALLLTFGFQTKAITQLNFAQLRVIAAQRAELVGTTMLTRAWNALKLAIATNPFGAVLAGIGLIATGLYLFLGRTKEVTEEMKPFNEEMAIATRNIDFLLTKLQNSKKGTNQFTNALQELNTIAIKYNATLLTEKNTLEEISTVRTEILAKMDEEMRKKRYATELDNANLELNKTLDPIKESIFAAFSDVEGGAVKATDVFAKIKDLAVGSTDDIIKSAKMMATETGLSFESLYQYLLNTRVAIAKFNAEDLRLKGFYTEKTSPESFDIAVIEKAKKEFEALDKINKTNAENKKKGINEEIKLETATYSEKAKNYEEYLQDLLKNSKKYSNSAALREAVGIELANLDKKQTTINDKAEKIAERRAEALKKLNYKYLADQEEFANFEAGIAAGRIAEMEDGIEKERKLNELAFANRMAAIEKEKNNTILPLLNDARDPKSAIILDFNATGYDEKTQDAINKAKMQYLQDQANAEQVLREANLNSEKDYAYKIKEIQRDMNDVFLTGLEKERAAINEKYDDLRKKAVGNPKVQTQIEVAQGVALNEMYRRNELDQLDFKREIEYKKNEIVYKGAKNQRRLEKENFDTYVKYERKKIEELKSSGLQDNIDEAARMEEALGYDTKLQKIKEQLNLQNDLVDTAKKLTSLLNDMSGLSGDVAGGFIQMAQSLNDAVVQISEGMNNLSSDPIMGTEQIIAGVAKMAIAIEEQTGTIQGNIEQNKKFREEFDMQMLSQNMSAIEYNAILRERLLITQQIGETELDYNARIMAELKRQMPIVKSEYDDLLFKIQNGDDYKVNEKYVHGTWFRKAKTETEWGSMAGMTYDEIEKLYTEGKLTEKTALLFETLKKIKDEGVDVDQMILEQAQAWKEALTGTTAEAIGDSIYQGLADGLNSAADFGDSFEGIIRTAIDSALKLLSSDAFKSWYDKLASDLESGGGLDDTELESLKQDWIALNEKEKAKRDAAYQVAGIDPTSTNNNASQSVSKNIQALTEPTGRQLEGLANSIRETGVLSLGVNRESLLRANELVQSSQAIQAYSAQSLGHLRNIDTNISAQLTLFNSLTKPGHSQGGVGLKVFI